jgi:Protein of unknown function (DUF3237)
MPRLELEMTYRFRTSGPLQSAAGSPRGERQYWEMTEGTLTGPRIRATIAMPGGDWYRPGPGAFGRPDVRVQLITADQEIVLLHYTGLVQATERFKQAAENGGATRYEDQYMRMVMFFDTGAAKYAWLTESVFIAEGRIAGKNEIEYQIYRVTDEVESLALAAS